MGSQGGFFGNFYEKRGRLSTPLAIPGEPQCVRVGSLESVFTSFKKSDKFVRNRRDFMINIALILSFGLYQWSRTFVTNVTRLTWSELHSFPRGIIHQFFRRFNVNAPPNGPDRGRQPPSVGRRAFRWSVRRMPVAHAPARRRSRQFARPCGHFVPPTAG